MSILDEKPTTQSIDAAKTHYENLWSQTHSKFDKVDDYYWRRYNLWDKDEYNKTRPAYRPSTPTNILDHAIDTQVGIDPQVHRDPIADGKIHKDRANLVEVGLKAVLDDAALKEMYLPWKTAGKYLLGYGYTIIEGPLWDMTGKVKKPVRKDSEDEEEFDMRVARYKLQQRSWNPIQIQVPHPASVLLDPLQKKPRFAIKMAQVTAIDLYRLSKRKKDTRRYAEVFDYEGRFEDYDTVNIVDFWTLGWHAVRVDGGEMLWVEKNVWGYVPFSHAFAGFGMEPRRSDGANPEYMAQGILEPVMDSIKVAAQAATAKHNLLQEASWASKGTKGDAAEAAQAEKRGQYIQGEPDDFWLMPTKEVTGWMFRIGEEYAIDIEQGTSPRALAGLREMGVSTVGQQAILSTAGQRKFAASAMQLQNLATIVGSRILQLVDVLGQPIGVGGKVLRPQDIEHNYDVRVTFEVVDPVLKLQERELGLREVQAGVISPETHREKNMRLENETQERDRLLAHELRQIPEFKVEMLRAKAMEEGMGTDVIQTALERTGGPTQLLAEIRGGGASPPVSDAGRELRQAVSPDTAKPKRIEIGQP